MVTRQMMAPRSQSSAVTGGWAEGSACDTARHLGRITVVARVTTGAVTKEGILQALIIYVSGGLSPFRHQMAPFGWHGLGCASKNGAAVPG